MLNMLKQSLMLKLKPIKLILILSLSFSVWITYQSLIKSLMINASLGMLFAQDLKLFRDIHQSQILCSFCLQSTTLILHLNFRVFLNFSMNNYPKLKLYSAGRSLILKNNSILILFLTMISNVYFGFLASAR